MIDIAAQDIALVLARALSGLLAGLYVAFAVAVMPALHRLPDDVFVATMRRINEVIVNPAFMLLFLGAPLLAVVLLRWHHGPLGVVSAVAGVAAFVITVAVNVPLNDALAADGLRSPFEARWVAWHAMRTVACIVAFGATLLLTSAG
ncbi:DUF1772 domain-containing protein [Aeromicrobium sp. CF3.5]|uniref:anthrone oxygenase family protein n=1 Tax=Aeromicrobium sp. CF3.5 TaxID=3373078 RepID=UPI003EE52E83